MRISSLFASVLVFVIHSSSATVYAQASGSMTDQVAYTSDIKPLVKNFCATCHAGENPEGDFTLTDYASVRKHVEGGNLLERINDKDDPMPPAGLMPSYMRRLFKTWADQGYKNVGATKTKASSNAYADFVPPPIQPVDIRRQPLGFELLSKMQGHWVGSMNLMGQDLDWMAFDYRAVAPSHIHGIFEGGTIGNLLTSFFVADYNGTRTIMARNGGLLNGIYRMSYFVLDHVERTQGATYYRLVDAYAGDSVMWMELTFYRNTLAFNAYTSRFGLVTPPKKHMAFQAKKMHGELAAVAAKAVNFPQNTIAYDFSKGLPTPDWGDYGKHTSATYMWETDGGDDLVALGKRAKDPVRIDQIPHLSKLTVSVDRNSIIKDKKLMIYLSRDALTTAQGKFIKRYGYIREELLDTLLLYPEISAIQDDFTFTYLHPGQYYLTVIADMNEDGLPSPGDVTHAQRKVVVAPESHATVNIGQVNVRN